MRVPGKGLINRDVPVSFSFDGMYTIITFEVVDPGKDIFASHAFFNPFDIKTNPVISKNQCDSFFMPFKLYIDMLCLRVFQRIGQQLTDYTK